jgi:hypothetical protein
LRSQGQMLHTGAKFQNPTPYSSDFMAQTLMVLARWSLF